jgi:Uma2 family endonuclease
MRLTLLLAPAVKPGYELFAAPLDWKVSDNTLFQPDLMVVRRPGATAARIEHSPLLAIEILSRSKRDIDRGLKRLAYAEAGVANYWIFDPMAPSLRVLALGANAGGYTEVAVVEGDASYRDAVFDVVIVPSSLVD